MRFVALCLSFALVAAAAVAGETPAERVKNLLAAGQQATPQAIAQAAAEYEALHKVAPDDVRIDYVYAVALVNQHRHRQALPLVNRYLNQHPRDLAAHCARIFVELSIRQFDAAWTHAIALAPAFDAAPAGEAELNETARFLGTVIGYLELARGENEDAQSRSEDNRRVLESLGKDYLAPFNEGRQVVSDRLTELAAEQKARQDRAAAEQDRRQVATTAAIQQNRAQLETGEQSLQSGTEQVRDAQRQLSVIKTQMASLLQDRARSPPRSASSNRSFCKSQQQLGNSRSRMAPDAGSPRT